MLTAVEVREPVKDRKHQTFKEELQEIARLEEEHNFLGVRFSLREGVIGSIIRAEELADHVLSIIYKTIELSVERESIPLVERYDTP